MCFTLLFYHILAYNAPMSFTVTKYPQGTFSWVDLSSTNMDATKAFLTGFFGWTAKDMPTGKPGMDYTMFYLDGKTVAGAGPKLTKMQHTPSFWSSYITVDDVDAMTTKAHKLGAKVMIPPVDVFDAGRIAGITDPTGASVMLWQPKRHIGAQMVNTVGAFGWNELYTHDIKTAQTFYADLFGWTYDTDEKSGYVSIQNNGRANGGMMAITAEMKHMPPNWTVYFAVTNIDESIVKVKKLGGKVYMGPKEISVGKIAMVAEPSGASFIIIEMSMSPEEWKE